MRCKLWLVLAGGVLAMTAHSQAMPARSQAQPDQAWIEESNRYTQRLIDVRIRHSPEYGSAQGLSQYDGEIANPRLTDELQERAERDAVIDKIKSQLPEEKNRAVAEDLQILIHAIDLDDRTQDFGIRREVPYINPSADIFQGIKILLDDQVAPERRPAAVIRLHK
jgi:hypothetical protein